MRAAAGKRCRKPLALAESIAGRLPSRAGWRHEDNAESIAVTPRFRRGSDSTSSHHSGARNVFSFAIKALIFSGFINFPFDLIRVEDVRAGRRRDQAKISGVITSGAGDAAARTRAPSALLAISSWAPGE